MEGGRWTQDLSETRVQCKVALSMESLLDVRSKAAAAGGAPVQTRNEVSAG